MTHWQDLPAGPELRVVIAQRLGWHMRQAWVGSNGIEYDYLIYNDADHLVYQREISSDDQSDEETLTSQTWLAAMNDPDCPRWDEDVTEVRDAIFGQDFEVQKTPTGYVAWVNSPTHEATAATEALALVKAWLAATEDDDG